jgi:exodeoxyribonuclease VII large subunit
MSNDITNLAASLLGESRDKVNSLMNKLVPSGRLIISEKKEELSRTKINLLNDGKSYLMRAGIIPENHRSRLINNTTRGIRARLGLLESYTKSIVVQTNNRITLDLVRMDNLDGKLSLLDPVNTLKRGYTVTSREGKILKSADEAGINDQIDTLFYDGEIRSLVSSKKKDKSKTR